MDRDYYDQYAELQDRHWWFVGRRRIVGDEAARVVATLDPPASGRPQLLDVGCGTGVMLEELSRVADVRGVDMEVAAVEHCHRRGFPDVQVAGEAPLPFDAGTFDVVAILDVLEHIDDDVAMLREIHRLLRPGGRMIATVPAFPSLWGPQDEISHHKRRYVSAELRRAVERGGLCLERATYFNTALFPPIAAIRLLRRLRPVEGPPVSDFEMTSAGPLNTALSKLFAAESAVLRRRDMPFGVSLMVVASRPAT